MAYLAERDPSGVTQPMLFENFRLSSAMNSYQKLVNVYPSRGGHVSSAYREVVRNLVRLAPSTHHEHVVHGNDHHMVNTLGLELLLVVKEARDMSLGAGGRESSRDSDQYDLLVLPLCNWPLVPSIYSDRTFRKVASDITLTLAGIVLDGDSASSYGRLLGCERDVGEANILREGVSDLELRHVDSYVIL